jgi:hypothetical protein
MIVRRSKLSKNFTKMANEVVWDERLGRIARSVLQELVARPPGWQTNAEKLWETAYRHRGARAESKRQYRIAFAELVEYGYMTREKVKIPAGEPGGGGFMTILTVYDLPQITGI